MSQIKRRQFLQFAGSTLATLGLSNLDLQSAGDKYGRVLAQGTPRKLALLVGINKYPDSPLQGCVTDVNLQQQLLIHRFGFNPQDIVLLTDEKATRQGILTAFEEHLIKQAKPNDVVVYHFSGHGSQVRDPDSPDCDFPDCRNSTFVPFDSSSSGLPGAGGVVPDIMGRSLFLLMYALKTENVTVVLDSCHSGGGTRGNFRVRARNSSSTQPLDAELAYQQQWLSKLNLSPAEFKLIRRLGVAKGVVIASAKRDQLAADASFNDFYAGAFTYLMTQYLWQQTSNQSFSIAVPSIARNTTRVSFTNQEPLIEIKPGSDYSQKPVYFINKQTPPAEAVITKIEGDRATLWLGGLDPASLAAFESGAILSVVDPQGRDKGRVQLESRSGLEGTAKLLDAVQPGAFLQERSRSFANNISLKIGLDPSLGNEANTAKQALQAIPRIEAVPLQQQEVQYIFGRMTPAYRQQLQSKLTNLPEVGSKGIFTPALELIPDSFGAKDESILDAIKRLRPKLQSLLAAYKIKTVLNANSSRLNVVASMRLAGNNGEEIANPFTIRAAIDKGTPSNPGTSLVTLNPKKLPVGTAVQISLKNNEANPLYCSLLVIDPTGEITVIFPNPWTTSENATFVGPGQTLPIPDPSKDTFQLVTQEPKGVVEVLILASRTPLRKALQSLRGLAERRPGTAERTGPFTLISAGEQNEASEVIDNLLEDVNIDTRSGSISNTTPSSTTVRNIDTTQLAALSITFEVI
ncbi:MAG: caspase family protein [Potamolinea sp.]